MTDNTTKRVRKMLLPWIRERKPFMVNTYGDDLYQVDESCGELSMGINAFTARHAETDKVDFIPFHYVAQVLFR